MSRQINHLKKALRLLEADLQGWALPPEGTSVKVEAPPPLTDETYFGVSLQDVSIPPCNTPPGEMAEMFEQLAQHHLQGADAPKIPSRAAKFVGRDLGRFALWASRHAFMSLDIDISTGRVLAAGERTFGLADGLVVCESGVFPYAYDTSSLTQSKTFRCRDRGFAALYIQARSQEKVGAMRCLAAIQKSHPASWSILAPWIWKYDRKTVEDDLEWIVGNSPDPIVELYASLVPAVMSREEFEQSICRLDKRLQNPDDSYRRRLWVLVRPYTYYQ